MSEDDPEPEALSDQEEFDVLKDLIVNMGEGDVRSLLYNLMGKARVDETKALDLFRTAVSSGVISCYAVNQGWRETGLSADDIVMGMIYDRPVFFVSMLAPPPSLEGIRKKILKRQLIEKFRSRGTWAREK